MRILVAFEWEHKLCEEAIVWAIGENHPHTEVVVTEPDRFDTDLESVDPHLVICGWSPPRSRDLGRNWLQLSPDPEQGSVVLLGNERREMVNPSLAELLAIVDEAERLATWRP